MWWAGSYGKEVGEVMDWVTGVINMGEMTGAVSYLTRMNVGPKAILACVLMAMMPLMNEGVLL